MKNDGSVQVFPTVVWSAGPGCHGNCGQKLYVKDGRLIKVEGDEDHPWNQGRACPRVLALKQYVYHPDRILHPLKRVGERGQGKFERITWDEAFDPCEKKLKQIRAEHGAEAVIFCQGTGRDIGGPISFLAYNFRESQLVSARALGSFLLHPPPRGHENHHGGLHGCRLLPISGQEV